MRRIALISEHASPLASLGGADGGGQNVYVDKVAQRLAAEGCAVDVFTRREDPGVPKVARLGSYRVIHVDAGPAKRVPKETLLPYMAEFERQMLRWCRARPMYDVVHANFFMSGLVALGLKRFLGAPMVVTFHALGKVRKLHQGACDGFPAERIKIEERIVRQADRIIAECPQDEEDIAELYRADRSKLRYAPCGIDPSELKPIEKKTARAILGWDSDAFTVLQLGRMVPRKGVDNVIRAMGVLHREHHLDARLMVVGGDSATPDPAMTPELGRLQQVAEEAQVTDQVSFVGNRRRRDLSLYYSAADVFVTTPWYEPFGITPLEAMACARPVVGAAVGGIQHTVVDGSTGYLVPPHDPASLANRLFDLYRDPKSARAMGTAGRARALECFTWSKVARRINDVYSELIPCRTPMALTSSRETVPHGKHLSRP